MACSEDNHQLIHRILDKEASEQEVHEFDAHRIICSTCRETYECLFHIEEDLHEMDLPEVPASFTDRVMNRLPIQRKKSLTGWLKNHPALVSAACFLILMLGYVFSLGQDQTFQAKVLKGSGQLTYAGNHTVVVPKDEVIKGDLIIKNGDVRIEGKVQGNVILVNSHSLMANAGEVTGHIETVNRAVGWVWYQIKVFFQALF